VAGTAEEAADEAHQAVTGLEPRLTLAAGDHLFRIGTERGELEPMAGDERPKRLMRCEPHVVTGGSESDTEGDVRLHVTVRPDG